MQATSGVGLRTLDVRPPNLNRDIRPAVANIIGRWILILETRFKRIPEKDVSKMGIGANSRLGEFLGSTSAREESALPYRTRLGSRHKGWRPCSAEISGTILNICSA